MKYCKNPKCERTIPENKWYCSAECKWNTNLPEELISKVQQAYLTGNYYGWELEKKFGIGRWQVKKAIDLLFGK